MLIFFSDVLGATRRTVLLLVVGLVTGLVVPPGAAQELAVALRTAPNALLTIDQNRSTVVDRVVREWGDALVATNAGITAEQLRDMLLGMRADYLLAASVAGSLEGLRDVVASSLIGSAPATPTKVNAKALGSAAVDLVYTPVTPCRIVDTRNAGGAFGAGEGRAYHAYLTSGTFASQGGAASNCGIPANPAAAALNITVISTGGGFLTAWPYNTSLPNASTLNYVAGQTVANGALIPTCAPGCADEFNVLLTGAGHLVVDIVGYFAMPGATALQCTQVASSATTIVVSADTLVPLPSCAAGYTRTGSNCSGTAGVPGGYLLETNASGCLFRNLSSLSTYQGTATATCCRVPGS